MKWKYVKKKVLQGVFIEILYFYGSVQLPETRFLRNELEATRSRRRMSEELQEAETYFFVYSNKHDLRLEINEKHTFDIRFELFRFNDRFKYEVRALTL